jgi:hypothetical protein
MERLITHQCYCLDIIRHLYTLSIWTVVLYIYYVVLLVRLAEARYRSIRES